MNELTEKDVIRSIRMLSARQVESAKSGHPGTPLGAAPVMAELYGNAMNVVPTDPEFYDRDRFVLSSGHASAMLYATLHICGFDVTEKDLSEFRQAGSRTPGHPERGVTPGVDCSTGPLGQGVANAVGMALAERIMEARFNRPGCTLVDHYTYAFCGDGCMMEGIENEAASLAGLWKLGRLIRKTAINLYEHSSIVSRELIPFFVIVLFNLCMGFIGGTLGILAAGIVDVAAGCLLYLERKDLQSIVEGTQTIGGGRFDAKIDASRMHGENRALAEAVNSIGDGIQDAVATSMKDERLKADLITNVSHDIKTPLTSIINFVKLLKREDIADERIRGYIEVLDAKSQRLKQLTDDLVEASKISSGNISLQMERINFVELINQTIGEFMEKMEEKCLQVIPVMPERPVYIEADSRRIWRVVENLFGNVYKYALEGTRVYLDLTEKEENGRKTAVFSMKNISAQPLNIDADELTERFIRGDVSRSTEGSGLGLSIAKNLTELQNGKFDIYLDGDLFKVILTFPCMEEEKA